jgi:hypothetical protein
VQFEGGIGGAGFEQQHADGGVFRESGRERPAEPAPTIT